MNLMRKIARGAWKALMSPQFAPVPDPSASAPFGEGKSRKVLFAMFPSLREVFAPRGRAYIGEFLTIVGAITVVAGLVALVVGFDTGNWTNAWVVVQVGLFGSISVWLLVRILGWVPPPDSTRR